MTDRAFLLKTATKRFAPEVGLVVPATPRLETQIPAERAHVALDRPRDAADRAGKDRIAQAQRFCRQQLRECGERANANRSIRLPDHSAERADAFDLQQHAWREEPHLQIGHDVRAARENHCFRPVSSKNTHGIFDGSRANDAHRGETHRTPRFSERVVAFFSRSCFCFSRIASRIFSGVSGKLVIRTPTASQIAFATAGMAAASEPSPASFAPNGPSGSSLSTLLDSIWGVSSVVGLGSS